MRIERLPSAGVGESPESFSRPFPEAGKWFKYLYALESTLLSALSREAANVRASHLSISRRSRSGGPSIPRRDR